MTRKWMLIPLAILIALIPALGCIEEGAPPDETVAKIAGLQAKAEANAALITQLQSRMSTVEGRAAGEVTQGELDALAAKVTGLETTIANLEAQIAELSEVGGTPDSPTVPVATETRWRPEVSYAVGGEGVTQNDIVVGVSKIDPFPIRESDVYVIEIVVQNKTNNEITFELSNLALTLTPSEGVRVSKYVDVYQVGPPYGVWWYTTISNNPTTGLCRRIRAEADLIALTLKANGTSGDSQIFKLELELIYGT